MHVSKGWGSEEWVCNSELYCGKVLRLNQGRKCSFHYHLQKDETFYVVSGRMILRYSFEDDLAKANTTILTAGDSFHVPIGLRHQFEGLEDTMFIEFSTQHFDEDSYRIVRGD